MTGDNGKTDWAPVEQALTDGIRDKVCTALALVVAGQGEVLFEGSFGRVSDEPEAEALAPEPVFDLASLTKPLATLPACLLLVESGRLDLFRPLGDHLDLPPHLARLSPAHLLTHTSGLPDWRPLYKEVVELPIPERQETLIRLIGGLPLEFSPGTGTLYSDLGFMLLQHLIEELAGLTLAEFVGLTIYSPLGLKMGFIPLPDGPGPISPSLVASEHCPWRGRLLRGEVNDENAWAAGGIAGQAGLFATPGSVWRLWSWLVDSIHGRAEPELISPETAGLILDSPFPGQPRTLGLDRPSGPTPSVGNLMDRGAVGHLGFTGTSLWFQPRTELTAILLTNRTIYGRDNDRIKTFRPKVHNLIGEVLGLDYKNSG